MWVKPWKVTSPSAELRNQSSGRGATLSPHSFRRCNMKRIYAIIALLVLSSVASFAFQPRTIASESKTKGTSTVSTSGVDTIMFQSSAATTVQLNGTGTAWPVAANTQYIWLMSPAVSSLVFNRTSSATATTVYSAR